MTPLLRDLKNYLLESMGLQLTLRSWGKGTLPFFLYDFYEFYITSMLGKRCIFVVAREADRTTPAVISKHLEQIHAKTKLPCVYVSHSVPSYNRKRLIEHRVQFVVPRRQIYLPALGIDWLDNCRICCEHRRAPKILRPATQVVILYVLLDPQVIRVIPLELARKLHYTPMTMSRALDELESHSLGKTIRIGKERQFCIIEDRSLFWSNVESILQTPVKKSMWLRIKNNDLKTLKKLGMLAGLSALSEMSLLSAPMLPIFAMNLQAWKQIQRSKEMQILPSEEGANVKVELWSYDPRLFAVNGHVDLFSLYLSLRETQDERVEKELQKLMKDIK